MSYTEETSESEFWKEGRETPGIMGDDLLKNEKQIWKHTELSLSFFLSQLEAFYSIFTTEQQDHVKSVEYLRNNFRPLQSLDNREVFKSAVKDAWLPDLTYSLGNPYGTEASKGGSSNSCSGLDAFIYFFK